MSKLRHTNSQPVQTRCFLFTPDRLGQSRVVHPISDRIQTRRDQSHMLSRKSFVSLRNRCCQSSDPARVVPVMAGNAVLSLQDTTTIQSTRWNLIRNRHDSPGCKISFQCVAMCGRKRWTRLLAIRLLQTATFPINLGPNQRWQMRSDNVEFWKFMTGRTAGGFDQSGSSSQHRIAGCWW